MLFRLVFCGIFCLCVFPSCKVVKVGKEQAQGFGGSWDRPATVICKTNNNQLAAIKTSVTIADTQCKETVISGTSVLSLKKDLLYPGNAPPSWKQRNTSPPDTNLLPLHEGARVGFNLGLAGFCISSVATIVSALLYFDSLFLVTMLFLLSFVLLVTAVFSGAVALWELNGNLHRKRGAGKAIMAILFLPFALVFAFLVLLVIDGFFFF